MIIINGDFYSDIKDVSSDILNSLIYNSVYKFDFRIENNKVLFLEESFFEMMSHLRRLRLNIPMHFNIEYFGDMEPIYKNINTIKYLKNLKDVTIPPECFTDKELIEIYKVHGRNLKIYDDTLGDLIKNRKIKVK